MKELEVREDYKKVYDTIFEHGKKQKEDFFISYAKISQVSGVEATMVSSILKNLREDGLITKHNHFNESGRLKANSYQKTSIIPVVKEPEIKKAQVNKPKKNSKKRKP